jgi:hypothetical protein
MQRSPTNLAAGKYRFKNIKLMIHRCSKGFGERSENSSVLQTAVWAVILCRPIGRYKHAASIFRYEVCRMRKVIT